MLKWCLKWTLYSHNFCSEADTIGEEVLWFKNRALEKKIIKEEREKQTSKYNGMKFVKKRGDRDGK